MSDGTIRRAELHWYEATGIGQKEFEIKRYLDSITMSSKRRSWVVCVRNDGYEASLERRKIYEVLPDAEAEVHNQLRVIDESGEDYLFPANYFALIELPAALRRALAA